MRNQFTYLDNNSTTRLSDGVREAMGPYLGNQFGNPSNDTSIGRKAKKAISQARRQVADLLGASPSEIVFTSCGSESNAIALHTCINHAVNNVALTTPVEHDSIRMHLKYYEQKIEVNQIPIDHKGRIDLSYLERIDSRRIGFCSIMLVNNELGNIFPVKRIAQELKSKSRKILIHTDAVQALGKVRISAHDLDVDYLSISGHKIHAPKGVGALYVRSGAPYSPLIFGHQENALRGGTENVASIVGFGHAAVDAQRDMEEKNKRISLLRDKIEQRILQEFPDSGINGDVSSRVSNTTNLYFPGIDSIRLLFQLELRGVFASTGSACNGKHPQESHVLTAIRSPYPANSIRISLDGSIDEQDADYFVDNCIAVVNILRGGK